ncbi:hypothetical protein FRX31_026770 [Thalictrum thalictroides]|uniref:Rna exonuclease n=1 Tax=Thalictrum thalictroides TaxID=46969 RepID=A0A7J6VG27_THATH|nr:hypothetical protein FRX31_026770 [Thalictrum thalictroides]
MENLTVALPVLGKANDRPQNPVSWSSLFQQGNANKLKTTLNHFKPIFSDGVVEVPEEVIEKGHKDWEDYLVGSFVEQDKMTAIEKGPIFIAGRLFVLRLWSPEIEKGKNLISSVPIWVKLEGVPKMLWSEDGLRFLASILSRPTECLDEATAKKTRLKFAKVCIEVDLNCSFPKTIKAKIREEVIEVKVEYTWISSRCTKCESFGNLTNKCTKKVTTVWQKSDEAGPSCKRNSQGEELIPPVQAVYKVVENMPTTTSPKGVNKEVCTEPQTMNRFSRLQTEEEESPVANSGTEMVVFQEPNEKEVTPEKSVDEGEQQNGVVHFSGVAENELVEETQEAMVTEENIEEANQEDLNKEEASIDGLDSPILVVGDEHFDGNVAVEHGQVNVIEDSLEELIDVPLEEVEKYVREKEMYHALVEDGSDEETSEPDMNNDEEIEVFKDHFVKEPVPIASLPPPTPKHRNMKREAKAKANELVEKSGGGTSKRGRGRPKGPV